MEQKNLNRTELLKAAGVTCRSCWWQEGGMCYAEPCEREASGRSKKEANGVCGQHESKRSVFANLFPPGMLTIASEEKEKAKGNDTGIY